MQVEQYVMAYEVEQDRLRALLPEGFVSLRPVLRINGEIRRGPKETAYLELNTPVEGHGKRGWLNVGHWDSRTAELSYAREGKTVTFAAPFLTISFAAVGVEGGCPAERDNEGCFFLGETLSFRPSQPVNSNKEFCDCVFAWQFSPGDAQGASQGKTLPPLQQLPRRRMKSAPSPRKTRRPFPAGRCWGPMWFGGSGGSTRRSRGPERGSRFG